MPSKVVITRTLTIASTATLISWVVWSIIGHITGIIPDKITVLVRVLLPFFIALSLGLFWFARLEKLERAYLHAVRHANEMARFANMDPLTGILNRRSFLEQFDVANATGMSGWFLLADIDYLKKINDQYGHLVGDDAVIAVAQALIMKLPLDSLTARIGGDEFCSFIPKDPTWDIDAAVIKIGSRADIIFKQKHPDLSIPLSISVSFTKVKANQTFESLMLQADQNLYRKKRHR